MEANIVGVEKLSYFKDDYRSFISQNDVLFSDEYYSDLKEVFVTTEQIIETVFYKNNNELLSKYSEIRAKNCFYDEIKIVKIGSLK